MTSQLNRFTMEKKRAEAVSALSSVLPKLINSNQKIAMKLAKTDSTVAMSRREAHYGLASNSKAASKIKVDFTHD